MEKISFTRQELYELVWKEPLSTLAKKHNLNVYELRKACKQFEIPIPINGYWSKLKFNKQVIKIELSQNYTGENEYTFVKNNLNTKILDSSLELDGNSEYNVPERLINPDQLIINTKKYHEAIKAYDWRKGGQYPRSKEIVNISVTEKHLSRAYRIMDTIIKILRNRHYEFKEKYDKTVVIIENEGIEFRLKERNIVSPLKTDWGSRQLEPTGELQFIIEDFNPKVVKDGREPLETKIAIIISKLESIGKQRMEETIKWEKIRKEQREKERIEQEIRIQKEKEMSNIKNLVKQANRWKQACILREFIFSKESHATQNGLLTDEQIIWLRWAKQKADWLDPLTNREDPLLDENYITQLYKEFLRE